MSVADFYPLFLFGNVLLGVLLALLFGKIAITFARQVKLIDVPNALPHKQHVSPVPMAGGLGLILSLGVGGVFNPGFYADLWRILLPATLVFLFGLWDDFKHLSPLLKFFGQFLAAALLILLGIRVQIIQAGWLGLSENLAFLMNLVITLLWVVGITNAFNLIDSMDGLALGIAIVALSFLALMTLGSHSQALLRLLTLLLGICLGLYFYNHMPAKLFLGDSGAQLLGFLLATLGITFTPGTYPLGSSWFIPILLFGVPIFDTALVIFSRLRRRVPFYTPDLEHTYHRLLRKGMEAGRAVFLLHLVSLLLGSIAFIALKISPPYSTMIFFLVCLIGCILILWMDLYR